jgi:hypothetical protein
MNTTDTKPILTVPCDQNDLESIRAALQDRLCLLSCGQSADESALGWEWSQQEQARISRLLNLLPRLI